MRRTSFNDNWTVGTKSGFFSEMTGQAVQPKAVTLPHDAMIERERAKPGEGGASGSHANSIGYYPEGEYDYKKTFFVPEEYQDKRVTIEFEGVYRNAMVYINGDYAGQCPSGYMNFAIRADRYLKYGQENEIKVVAMNYKDSRWYTGSGIYRNVKLIVANLVHIALDGVQVSTPDIRGDLAVVATVTAIENESIHTRTVRVLTEILDADGLVVASDIAPVTAFAGESAALRQRLYVRSPRLWSVERPYLYSCRSSLLSDGELLDEEENGFGIRSLTLDPDNGLRINGETVKLRGACLHHDNGVLGAATIDRAEERRIEILKQAGFNAIRSAHNPISKALLDACDRLGMLVMDEAFDMWTSTKTDHDYALHFPLWWEKELEAMVKKNYNHPSVIMYSIGNEIPETGRPIDSAWGRKLAEKIRSLDGTRYVTNSINFMVAIMEEFKKMRQQDKAEKPAANEGINTMMNKLKEGMAAITSSPLATEKTAESFAYVDIAAYNYADNRYLKDRELFPNRIIVGGETYPSSIDRNWKLVKENGHVIGDFTWTGWDYLGESGIGKIVYDPRELLSGVVGAYPWLSAWVGDIDITGHRRPISYYREIVFGLRKDPYLAVLRPENYGKEPIPSMWSWSDSVSSWSWNGYEGLPVKVEVYADAEEVELLINGKSAGKAPAGEEHRYKAEFDTVYEPGEAVAIAYSQGREIGRTSLRSAAGPVRLHVEADRTKIEASDGDLSFLAISLVDGNGNLYNAANRKVKVEAEGAGIVQGFGSADPRAEENFFDAERTTFDGRALAVIRPTGAGSIRVTVSAEGCEPRFLEIEVAPESKNPTRRGRGENG